MKKIYKSVLPLMAGLLAFSACEPDYDKEYSTAYPVCGDWKVIAYVDEEAVYGPFEMKIYNTSFGTDSVWIDDYTGTSANFYDFKVKAALDIKNKSFQTTGSISAIEGYGIEIKVTDGQVFGTDSIEMGLEFEDDPGTVYVLRGHRGNTYEDYFGE